MGGIQALSVSLFADYSFYQDGSTRAQSTSPNTHLAYAQVWRIEGPNMVLHFQGYPHVHAYLNIIDDTNAAPSGERIAHTDSVIQGNSVRRLLIGSIKQAADTQYAYYPAMTHGRIPVGDISTGSVYGIDPFNENISIVIIRPSEMGAPLKESLIAQGANLNHNNTMTIACNDYALVQGEQIGKLVSIKASGLNLRNAVIEQIKHNA